MKIPPSLSLIRGLSSTGIGEGDHDVSHGEQYLLADQALVASDRALFAEARPWLTLDTDPLDRNALGDKLVSWSVFNRNGRIFVVHLGPADNYDKRPAYFSHAIVWAWEECAAPFDPLLYFGFTESFERPWRLPTERRPINEPVVPDRLDVAFIREHRNLAINLLAACRSAITHQQPLVIAAPVEKLARGGMLESLARFAMAALPRTDKQQVAVRFYTRRPEQLIEQSGADIVFAPEATVTPLLRNSSVTVMDGKLHVISGKSSDDLAHRYAEGVYRNFLRLPDSLIAFTNHFAQVELNDEEKVRLLPVIYNLADALGAGDKERRLFLTRFLPDAPQRVGLPLFLRSLASPKQWSGFPPDALIEILLPPSTGDSKANSLAMELAQALDGSGWSLDEAIRAWWNPRSDDKLNRLLLLAGNTRSLLSESVLLDLLKDVPLTRIPSAEYVCWLLAAEDRAGTLSHRSTETDPLIQLAREDGDTRQLLFEATAARRLGVDWIRRIIEDPRQEQELFQALFENVFADIREIQRWGGMPERLAFAAWRSEIVSPEMAEQAVTIAGQCSPVDDFPLLLELASLEEVANRALPSGQSLEEPHPYVRGYDEAITKNAVSGDSALPKTAEWLSSEELKSTNWDKSAPTHFFHREKRSRNAKRKLTTAVRRKPRMPAFQFANPPNEEKQRHIESDITDNRERLAHPTGHSVKGGTPHEVMHTGSGTPELTNQISRQLRDTAIANEENWNLLGVKLVEAALDTDRPGISPRLFIENTETGGKPIDWVRGVDTLPKLLAAPEFRGTLGYPALLELAGYAPDSLSMDRIMEEIDGILLGISPNSEALRKHLSDLLRSGLWGYWRKRFTPRENLNASKLAEYWFELNAKSDRKSGIPMEEWQATLKGLILDSKMLGWIWPSAKNGFPWIAPFERRQVADLAGCAADLNTLGSLRRRLLESGTGGIGISLAELEEILDVNCRSPNKIAGIAEAVRSTPHDTIYVIAEEDLWDWRRIAEAIVRILSDWATTVQTGGRLPHNNVFLTTLNQNAEKVLLPPDTSRFNLLAYRLGELDYSRLADRLSSNITIDVELDRLTEEFTDYLLDEKASPVITIPRGFGSALGRWENQQGTDIREFDYHPLIGLAYQVKDRLEKTSGTPPNFPKIWKRLARAVRSQPNLAKPIPYPEPWLPLLEVAALFSIDKYLSGLAKKMVVSCNITAQSNDWLEAVYYSMERLANGERIDDYMPREASEYDAAFAEFESWLQDDMG
uniref:Uncharacterized protein n=1 Tax=Candidatus Kentrum sp. DK TaxID=2126562 RepID=A0A450SCH1_9GAMM|nr:MAG: hypothetical protein BECKDK2373C_GA0170839_102728 [Candidatus Kentron sp. DK]